MGHMPLRSGLLDAERPLQNGQRHPGEQHMEIDHHLKGDQQRHWDHRRNVDQPLEVINCTMSMCAFRTLSLCGDTCWGLCGVVPLGRRVDAGARLRRFNYSDT